MRQDADKTQKAFGASLGVSRDTYASYESGRVTPSKTFVQLLCSEYNVSIEWFNTGNGAMYVDSQDMYVDKLAKQYGLGEYARKVLDYYGALNKSQKEALEIFIREISGAVMTDSITNARNGVASVIASANMPDQIKIDLMDKTTVVLQDAFSHIGTDNTATYAEDSNAPEGSSPVDAQLRI